MDNSDNLAELPFISEDGIVQILTKHHKEEKFYSKIGQIYLKINSYPNHRSEFKDSSFVQELAKWSKSGTDKSLADKQHIFRFAEELRRYSCDGNKTHSLILRGLSGAGKSEAAKRMFQYLTYLDMAVQPEETFERDFSKPFCTYANPYYVAPDAPVACKRIAACLSVLESFYTAPTDHNPSASRVWNHFKVKYGSNGKISGFRVDPIFTEFPRCNPKEVSVGPLTIQTIIVNSVPNSELDKLLVPATLREQYPPTPGYDYTAQAEYLKEMLFTYGNIPREVWENHILKVFAAIINLQGITLLGTESAIISSSTKSFLGQAEQLLGFESGTLGPVILKKPDERIGRPSGSVIDCRPQEAKYLLELLCAELVARMVTFLLNEMSFNFPFHPHSANPAETNNNNAATSVAHSVLHVLDPIGWDRNCLNQQGTLATLLNHYCEEKCNEHYLLKAFQDEFDRYAREGIVIDSVTLPDWNVHMDVLERSVGGFIQILEETCANQRAEDKQIADKMILNHNKSKLVKAGGTKTKQSVFVIKHTFSDVSYDCDGFITTNKLGTVPSTITNVLKTSKIPFVTSESLHPYKVQEAPKDESKPKGSLVKARTEGQKGNSPSQYLFHKGRHTIEALLSELNRCEKTNYLLCLNIVPYSKSNEPAPSDYLVAQLRNHYIEGIIKLAQSGYSYSRPYHDIYRRFRVLIPFSNTKLPLYVNETIQKNYKEYCRLLLKECVTHHGLQFQDPSNPTATWEQQITYGNNAIFMKEKFAIMLESYRFNYYEKSNFSCLLLQSMIRMRKHRNNYLTSKKGMIIFQSNVRKYLQRKKFRELRSAALFVKSLIIVNYRRNFYLRLKKSVKILKKSFLGKAIQRIRFKRLIKVNRQFQFLARGFIIRKYSQNIFDSIKLIQKTAKSFLYRKRLKELRLKSVSKLQYNFRGYLARKSFASFIQVLKVRKEQRVAQRVVMKIQSLWRKRLIQERFQEVVSAVVILQRWLKTRLQRKWHLNLKFLVLLLQSHWRRIIASNLVNNMKVTQMVKLEKASLSDLFHREISVLKNYTWDQCVVGEYLNTKKEFRKLRKLLLTYDLCFDFTPVYYNQDDQKTIPQDNNPGWLKSILQFQAELHKTDRYVTDIHVGNQHTVILDDKSNLYTMGFGDLGQLGHGNRKSLSFPRKIEKLKQQLITGYGSLISSAPDNKIQIISLCCGKDHTLLLTQGGLMYSFGDNRKGQLGHSHFESSSIPKAVVAQDQKPLKNVIQIACGSFHSACIVESGILYTWGSGDCLGTTPNFRLAVDDQKHLQQQQQHSDVHDLKMPDSCCPSLLPFFQKRRIAQVVCGENHTTVLTHEGLYAWGSNNQYGQLGLGHTKPEYIPRKVPIIQFHEFDTIHGKIFSGGRHMLFLLKGRIWLWGWNKYGQIGDGTTDNCLLPMELDCNRLVSKPLNNNNPPPPPLPLGSPTSGATSKKPSTNSKLDESTNTVTMPFSGKVLNNNNNNNISATGNNRDRSASTASTAFLKTSTSFTNGTSNNNTKKNFITSAFITWRQSVVITKQNEIYAWGVVNSVLPYTKLVQEMRIKEGLTDFIHEEAFEFSLKPKLVPIDETVLQQKYQISSLSGCSNFTLSFVDVEIEPIITPSGHPTITEEPFPLSKSVTLKTPSKSSLTLVPSSASSTKKATEATSPPTLDSKKGTLSESKKLATSKSFSSVINKNTSFTKSVKLAPPSDEVTERFRQEVGRITLYPGNQKMPKKKSQRNMSNLPSEESKTGKEFSKQHSPRSSSPSKGTKKAAGTAKDADHHGLSSSSNDDSSSHKQQQQQVGKAEALVELFQPNLLKKMKDLKHVKQERIAKLQREQQEDDVNLDFSMFAQQKRSSMNNNNNNNPISPSGGMTSSTYYRSRNEKSGAGGANEKNSSNNNNNNNAKQESSFLQNFLQGTEGIANVHMGSPSRPSHSAPPGSRRLSGSPLSRFITSKAEDHLGPDDSSGHNNNNSINSRNRNETPVFSPERGAEAAAGGGGRKGGGSRDSFIWSASQQGATSPSKKRNSLIQNTNNNNNNNYHLGSASEEDLLSDPHFRQQQEKARRAKLFSPNTPLLAQNNNFPANNNNSNSSAVGVPSPNISFKEQMHELGYLRKKTAPRFLFSDHASPLLNKSNAMMGGGGGQAGGSVTNSQQKQQQSTSFEETYERPTPASPFGFSLSQQQQKQQQQQQQRPQSPSYRKDFKTSGASLNSGSNNPVASPSTTRNSLEKLKRELVYMQQKQT
jgi:alpha-tubulin suppressor-like RCC1 family protein